MKIKNNILLIVGILIITILLIQNQKLPTFYIDAGYNQLEDYKLIGVYNTNETNNYISPSGAIYDFRVMNISGEIKVYSTKQGYACLLDNNNNLLTKDESCARFKLLTSNDTGYCLYYDTYDILECIREYANSFDLSLCDKVNVVDLSDKGKTVCRHILITKFGEIDDCKEFLGEMLEDCYYEIAIRTDKPEGCRLLKNDGEAGYQSKQSCLSMVNQDLLTTSEKGEVYKYKANNFLREKWYTSIEVLISLIILLITINIGTFLFGKQIVKFTSKYLFFIPSKYILNNSPGFVAGIILSLIPWVVMLFNKGMTLFVEKQNILSYISSASLYPMALLVQLVTKCNGEECMIHLIDPYLALIIYPIIGLISYSIIKRLWRK